MFNNIINHCNCFNDFNSFLSRSCLMVHSRSICDDKFFYRTSTQSKANSARSKAAMRRKFMCSHQWSFGRDALNLKWSFCRRAFRHQSCCSSMLRLLTFKVLWICCIRDSIQGLLEIRNIERMLWRKLRKIYKSSEIGYRKLAYWEIAKVL